MTSNINFNLKAYAAKEGLYKIESIGEKESNFISNEIKQSGGCCVKLGSAIVTNHSFSDSKCVQLIGRIYDHEILSTYDIQAFMNKCEIM